MSDEKKLLVTARARVSVELEIPSNWEPGVTAAQVFEQATQSGRFLIEKIFDAAAKGELEVNGVRQHIRGKVTDVQVDLVVGRLRG